MKGNEFKELLETHNLSLRDAADCFGFSHVTIHRSVEKGEEDISPELAEVAIEYTIKEAQESLARGALRMNTLLNQIIHMRA